MSTGVDEYVAGFPDEVRPILEGVAAAFRRALPGAKERISYGIASFELGRGQAVYFGGWKRHVGIYPVGPLEPGLEADVAPHRDKKDTVRFDYAGPVPYELIERILAAIRERHTAQGDPPAG